MATNGWKTWKSNVTGCIVVVGESDTLEMVMQPLDEGIHLSVVGLQSLAVAALPVAFATLSDSVSDR